MKQRDRPQKSERQQIAQRVCDAILLVAAGKSPEEIARIISAKPATLEAWQSSQPFQTVLDLVREAYTMRDMSDSLSDLTPDALDAFRRALSGPSVQWAVLAAREVLDRMERLAERQAQHHAETTMTVEFVNPEGQTVEPPTWTKQNQLSESSRRTKRDHRKPRALQSGRLRKTLRQDRDGQADDHPPRDDEG